MYFIIFFKFYINLYIYLFIFLLFYYLLNYLFIYYLFIYTFSASLLQSSVSHDPSEIILICWFAAQEMYLVISVETG